GRKKYAVKTMSQQMMRQNTITTTTGAQSQTNGTVRSGQGISGIGPSPDGGFIKMDEVEFTLKEADVMKDFRHRNVLDLVGVGMYDGWPALIMPYMSKGDLTHYVMDKNNRITLRNILEISIQVAQGMEKRVSVCKLPTI